jgi:transposase
MVKVDEYARIRRAHRVDKMSIRELSRRFHHSRRKIREILSQPEPKRYRCGVRPSVVDPFKPVIDTIVQADEQAPPKQRHTAAKIYRRLRDEHGYPGGYERVRHYLQDEHGRQRETFIPLDHDPGQRLEADFGHIYVDFPTGRQQVPVLMVTWAYSNCPFALALPSERTEAILHGLVEAFGFFGCVPRELWWDNPKTVAAQLYAGRQRQLHDRYQALASHYTFEPLFCLVRRPQEKPRVEGRVRHLQRDWATPVPVAPDLAALNAYLRACCLRDRERVQSGQTESIGQRFARESDKALSLPAQAFDPCVFEPAKVDKYQMVRYETNRYSVPRSAAFQTVTIKAYVERIDVVLGRQVIASHPRSYGRHEQVLAPEHYLDRLERRPAALDHANVFRRWQLPPVFGELRQALERQHGDRRGAKHYIRVLQLLQEHTVAQVERAIAQSQTEAGYDVEALLQRVRRQSADGTRAANGLAGTGQPAALDLSRQPEAVRAVQVPPPDVSKFNQFLTFGEKSYERSAYDVIEDQPEATAAADDASRVRGVGPRGGDGQRELSAVPAAADGAGGDGAGGERAQGPHQAGELPGAEGLRQLRLHGPAVVGQAARAGAGGGRVDRTAFQYLLSRSFGDRQNAPGHCPGPGGLPAGAAGALLHGGGPGQPPGGSAEAVPARSLRGATAPRRRLDRRRAGLPVVQPCGGGVAVPGVRRPLRAEEPAGDEQLAVRRLGASVPGRAHDGGLAGSADASLPHLRDEWRKLPLPGVDESEEEQGREVSGRPPWSRRLPQLWRAWLRSAARRCAPDRSAPPGPPQLRGRKPTLL